MSGAVHRVAIVNRGEAAMRLINAVREYRLETGQDVRTIALYTAAESRAMFVREADEAVCIDLGRDPGSPSPYLDLAALEAALVAARADAAWVGWGFVAERPEFAELCDRLGVTFVGPRPEVMRQLGDKIGAKLIAEQSNVPVAAWSGGAVDTVADARVHAAAIGYPLMIKATAGGGGRGIRKVEAESELEEAFHSARAEGLKAFGDATVFMERVVTAARHVEVQIIADEHGNVWPVGVRDCSMQRRNQKVLEESQCILLTPAQDADLRAAAARLARAVGYTNAGTVEFLYQPADQSYAFLEVNTRLQVEHPITELTTGLDLVKLQLHVAAGGRLEGEPPPTVGYSIEARLNAEDPQRGFAPAPGTIELMTLPVGPGIRVDTGVAEGDVIPAEYDSMIAKVIAYGATRQIALARLNRALSQMTVIVTGGTTNKSFLLDLIETPEVQSGQFDTAWLDQHTAAGAHLPTRLADVALIAAALDASDLDLVVARESFLSWGRRGRPQVESEIGRTVELRHDNRSYEVVVRQMSADSYEAELGPAPNSAPISATISVATQDLGRARRRLSIGDVSYLVTSSVHESDHLVEVDGVAHRFSRDDAGVVRAPSAALVVGVDVEVDSLVEAGTRLATVEAMKMEIAISAPISGRIRDVFVGRNAQVVAGAPLFKIEATGDASDADSAGSAIEFGRLASGVGTSAVATVRAFLLGYDVDAKRAREAAADIAVDDPTIVGVLDVISDISALMPERVDAGDVAGGRGGHEYFNSYLRSLDTEREGLPPRFCERLSRALRHYGVESLERTTQLTDALLRIFVAHTRRDERATLVSLLEPTLEASTDVPGLREAFDRLIEGTRRNDPALASYVRNMRYAAFDEPLIDQSRAELSSALQQVAAQVASGVSVTTHDLAQLVACPLPLTPILNEGQLFRSIQNPAPFLEALTRRYYRIRDLSDLTSATITGTDGNAHVVTRSSYDHRNRTVHVLAVRTGFKGLVSALDAVASVARTVVPPDRVVVDVYVPLGDEPPLPTAELADRLAVTLGQLELPAVLRRLSFMAGHIGSRSNLVTFRRVGADGIRPYWMSEAPENTQVELHASAFEEDVKFRGLHPMIARRLQMWRLANFDIRPLPADGEVHLFNCVARDNASDRRLVAVAEVRDLTPVLDESGLVVALPELEHLLVSCLDAIRQARSEQPGADKLEWNRVMLYVWPVVTIPLQEIDHVARRLAPLTEGLGLEQVVVSGRVALNDDATDTTEVVVRIGAEPGTGLAVRMTPPPTAPMQPLDDYARKVQQTRRRGLTYPYELIPMLTGNGGSFVEYDLASNPSGDIATDSLIAVDRAPGNNTSGIIVGVVSRPTPLYPEGVRRVALLGDPTRAMGSITESECRRLLAAIDLAAALDVPIEWFALSGGAKIAMDSGSENLDWVARVLRRLVEHTQAGHEINVIVAGINVGAQPYWNAESTMLMHTKGILVMTPESAMVLTGKQAIDYSGGVSAEDNFGIGGYRRIMGPNGEAQYFAPTLAAAADLLFHHYDLTYRAPGERWPRRVATTDPIDRDVRPVPHVVDGCDFTTVGDIFSADKNPDRKKPFDIRTVMNAVIDVDTEPLERWPEMAEAEMAVVYTARLGGHAVTLIGMESRPLPRHGETPADGVAQWSAGTLFPLSSKKIARTINASSGERPVVMLANLSGFDGSPESLRRLQLEYGAEIGRAIVNFDGPFVLCVVSRYHGGAFVVFSATLNDRMEVLAVEGSFASVIGGAPAAAVVFTREVDERTRADARFQASPSAWADVRIEKLGEVAAEFDSIHSVARAQAVGSVHRTIAAADLRSELIAAVERGIAR
ncbi:MAG TPA: carboxyl transferase domain-containing protein [Ilumatobacter sp.]|nr:carboxyl transferase domain-containing protein [Ilumatobacter sp.]